MTTGGQEFSLKDNWNGKTNVLVPASQMWESWPCWVWRISSGCWILNNLFVAEFWRHPAQSHCEDVCWVALVKRTTWGQISVDSVRLHPAQKSTLTARGTVWCRRSVAASPASPQRSLTVQQLIEFMTLSFWTETWIYYVVSLRWGVALDYTIHCFLSLIYMINIVQFSTAAQSSQCWNVL